MFARWFARSGGNQQQEAIDDVADAGDLHQQAKDPRQVAGVPDQVPLPQQREAEEDQAKRFAIRVRLNRELVSAG
jgi:hypothetical protein